MVVEINGDKHTSPFYMVQPIANHSFNQILRLLMHSIVVHVCCCIEHP